MGEMTCGGSRIQDPARFVERTSYTHVRLLQNRAQRELAAMQRLSEISPATPLVNETWRIFLMILAENLRGVPAYAADLAERTGTKAEIALRYFRVLESDRLVLLGEAGPKGHSACIGDEGLLRAIRYFLPEAAND